MAAIILEAGLTIVLIVAVPVLSFQTSRQLEVLCLPRLQLYQSAAMSQWILAIVGAGVVWATPLSFYSVGFRRVTLPEFLLWTLFLAGVSLLALIAVIWFERRGWMKPEGRLVRALIPQTRIEKIWAVLVISPTAALCEEFLYRGFLQAQLSLWLRSVIWATVLSCAAFGLAHAYQGLSGMARAALLGALLTFPVNRLSSILPSMAAHFLIDAAALVWLGPKLPGEETDTV